MRDRQSCLLGGLAHLMNHYPLSQRGGALLAQVFRALPSFRQVLRISSDCTIVVHDYPPVAFVHQESVLIQDGRPFQSQAPQLGLYHRHKFLFHGSKSLSRSSRLGVHASSSVHPGVKSGICCVPHLQTPWTHSQLLPLPGTWQQGLEFLSQ